MRFSIIVLLCVGISGQAVAKTYSGSEAAALRCVNSIGLTAAAMYETNQIGEDEKDVMIAVSALILERHVSGTKKQKFAALDVMNTRRDLGQTLEDFRRISQRCLKQFPIN